MAELFDVVDEQDRVVRQEARAEVHRLRLLHRAVHILVFNARGEVYLQRRSAKKDTYPNRWTTSCVGHVDAGEDYDTAAVRELAEELGLKGAKLGAGSGERGVSGKGEAGRVKGEVKDGGAEGKQTKQQGTVALRRLGTEGNPGKKQGAAEQTTKNAALRTKTPSTKSLHSTPLILRPYRKHPPCRETGWEFIWIYTLTTEREPAPNPAEISEGRWIAPADFDAWIAREPKAFTPSFILVWKLWRGKNA